MNKGSKPPMSAKGGPKNLWKNLPWHETPRSPIRFVPKHAVVSVMVNEETNDLTVLPTSVHLETNQPVRWIVWVQERANGAARLDPEASVLLSFRDARAVGTSEVRSKPGEAAEAKTTAAVGRYHYKVMVSSKNNVYADVGCPSMTIKN